MKTPSQFLRSSIVMILLASGCGKPDGPQFVAADGVVNFAGGPLAGATVTFVPEKGPVAIAQSDQQGKFVLATGANRGSVVGPVTVVVSVPTLSESDDEQSLAGVSKRPESAAEAQEYLKNANEVQQKMQAAKRAAGNAKSKPKPILPKKYGKADTSDLKYVVSANPKENHFVINLQP